MSLQMRKTMVLASDELPSTTHPSTFLWDDILYKAAIRHNMLRIASSLSHSRGRSAWGALESVELRSQIRSTAFRLLQIISFIVSSIFFGSLSPPPPFPLSTFFQCWYDSFSDVGESRVYFASKILTPCRMNWNAFLIAQIIAKCHSFPNMYGML